IYQLQNGVIMGLLTTLMGTASLIGMVGAPIIVRFIGKRNLNIGANILFAIAYGLTFFSTGSFYVTFVLIYIANAANATSIITGPAINADILDYHQWKTGKRMDGFFGNISIITSVVGMATGFVIPAVTESYGLLTNYDVLYESAFRGNLIRILAVISFIGGLACCVPMIFYNLSEKKLRGMMRDLKRRTLLADLEAGDITQEEYDEKIKEIEEQEIAEKEKEAKKKAKKKGKTNGSEEVEIPAIESELQNTAVPTVDVIEKTALIAGEIEASNEDAESEEENKEQDAKEDSEGGKQ
ncbi:MAG: MFS transporter, partial [Clostridia bacterium]|nr:MFS transporter [Clostridia bacterium]